MGRLVFQIINGLVGLVTLALGTIQLIYGVHNPIYANVELQDSPILDSNLRFFGGMSIGLGVALLWILPRIEMRTLLFRAVWLCAFLGGLGRLLSAAYMGVPSTMLLAFTILEVIGAPLLVIWQSRLVRDRLQF